MEWHPSRFFRASGSSSPYALLVLNQPINERAFGVLSEHAAFIICADGGANRLHDMMKNDGKESSNLPDAIVGDLDSIRPSVREHYSRLSVPILQDPNKYSTDFTKCLTYLNAHAAEILAAPRRGPAGENAQQPNQSITATTSAAAASATTTGSPLEILILGGLGGRVDQAFSQIHHLYMMTQTQRTMRETLNQIHEHNPDQMDGSEPSLSSSPSSLSLSSKSPPPSPSGAGGNLYLISEESITFILETGKNIIYTPRTRRADIHQQEETEDRSEEGKEGERGGEGEGEGEESYFFEENIGIIPMSAPAHITTQGLEWDVQHWHTEIGLQISTSNHIRADVVVVETSGPVLFTIELAGRFKRGFR